MSKRREYTGLGKDEHTPIFCQHIFEIVLALASAGPAGDDSSGKVLEANKKRKQQAWYSSSLALKIKYLSLPFLSPWVRVPSSIDAHPVPGMTTDSTSDAIRVALAVFKGRLTLGIARPYTAPLSCAPRLAASGLPLNVLGFINFQRHKRGDFASC